MKRKLVFAIATVAMLCCLFAISASAAEIPDWTEITVVEGMPDKSDFGDDGKAGATSRVLMSDGVTYPAYYICKNSTSLGFSYTDLNSKTGKSYSAVDVIRLEVPKGTLSTPLSVLKTENGYTSLTTASFPEGFTTLGGYTFKGTSTALSSLVSVSLPSTLNSIGEAAFTDCYLLEALIIPEGVTSIPKNMALNTTSLKTLVLPSTLESIGETAFKLSNLSDGIVIPEGCTTISGYAFKESGVTSVVLPSTLETLGINIFHTCHSLTTIHSKSPIIGESMFYDCDEITTIKLENTVTIGKWGFCNPNGGILKITSLELPEGLTTIGSYAFARSQLTELVLPSTLTDISDHAFTASQTLKRVVALNSCFGATMFENCSSLCELVLTEKFDTLGSGAMNSVSSTSFITYYTGTDYDRIKNVFSATSRFSQAKYYSYEDYLNENYTYNKFMVIYDSNICDVAYDSTHLEDNNPCVVSCQRCGLDGVAEANPVHNEIFSVVFENGFDNEGAKLITCSNKGCTHEESTEIPAIFTCLGYSVRDNGSGIATGFKIDHDSLEAYESFVGEKLTFGVTIFNPKYLGESTIFTSEGVINTSKGAIQATIDLTYSSCSIWVSGINLNDAEHASLELVFAGYAYVGDDMSTTQVFQKDYTGTEEAPVSSPMVSKVTRGDDVLYTVKLQSVLTPAQITTGKNALDEY